MAYSFEQFLVPGLAHGASQFDAFAPPVEDPSLLSQIGGSALSGLGWLAEVLAKPDRILYALPSGNPQELLNILPFSDTFGWTDPSNMASASTALENLGVLPENTPGFDWWDPVRLGADILGSPSTYASFGASALTKGGEVARAAGVLDDLSRVQRMTGSLNKLAKGEDAIADIATAALRSGAPLGELYNQPLQGLVRFGIPFTNVSKTVGFGPTSQAIAGTLDTAGSLIGKTPVIGPTLDATRRFGRMLFDPSAKNRFAPREQELAELAYRDRDAIKVAARGEEIDRITQSAPIRQAFHEAFGEDIAKAAAIPEELGGAAAEQAAREAVDDVYDRLVRMTADVGGDVATAWEQLMPDARMNDDLARQIRDFALDMQGANLRDWTEVGEMGLPAPVMEEMAQSGHFPRQVDQKLRQEFSSLRAQRLAGVRHPSAAARADELRYVPTEVINQMLVDPAARGANAADHILSEYGRWLRGYEEGPAKHAQALAEWIAGHKNEWLFTRKWITDQVGYKQRVELAKANGRAIHEMISRTMGEAGDVAVDNAFKRAGMDANAALTFLSKKTGKTPSQLAGLKVPADVAEAVAAYIKPHKSAEWAEMIQAVMGRFNQWFRRNVTLPFAQFAARNGLSGQHVNLFASGLVRSFRDVGDYWRRFGRVAKLLKNPESDAETVRELFKYGMLPRGIGFEGVEMSGGVGGMLPKSALDIRSTWAQAGLDVAAEPSIVPGLDKMPGGKLLRRVGKTWMGTGERLNQNVEALNRAPMFLYLRDKGWSPLAAAKKVNELQFDYSELTSAEQALRNTVVPFYCVPDHSEILTRDGWKRCDDLKVGEEVLTYNQQHDEMEWQPCLEKAIFDHDQPLTVLSNSRHRIECTGEHRWAVRSGHASGAKLLACDLLNTNHAIVVSAQLKSGGESLLTPDEARLLGWLVTDGSVRKKGRHVEAVLCQSQGKFLDEAAKVAGNKPRKSAHPNGTRYITVARDRKEAILRKVGYDVIRGRCDLLPIIVKLDKAAASAMYDAMYMADGLTSRDRKQDAIAARNTRKAEAIQVLAFLLGKRATVNRKGCNISDRRWLKLANLKRSSKHYSGRVWCPKTENQTWVMRQNGLVTITGNTFQRKVAPLIYRNLIERPGGGVAQTIRATNYARGDRAQAATTPDYVSQTTSIPLGTLADGSQRFLTGLGLAHEVPAQYLGGGLREGILEGLSQLSPLLKTPLEWGTGQSFFQRGPGGAGRPLETMDPTIRRTITNIQERLGGEPAGRLPPPGLLEFAAANSPFSRYLTTARQLSDPRKGILGNVMMQTTGLRFTDISPAAQEATLRQRAAELMKEMGARTFEKVYFDKDEIPNLPPEDQETATKLNALQRLLARKASARARLAEAGR